jgi:hypothetical protein
LAKARPAGASSASPHQCRSPINLMVRTGSNPAWQTRSLPCLRSNVRLWCWSTGRAGRLPRLLKCGGSPSPR